ncbi:unnamed protein product [Adineta ricciae]|uniref:Uncharacterized protein n=1 Tax=Adineta ricciae TaxID=249248 RepID=A0A815ANS0_ADIRI|nr:unnamed protein product [Adineta ricciae]CAF1258185.1 unnamed protein product [Adineta ricciae]
MCVLAVILFYLIFLNKLSLTLKCYECTGYVPCGSGQTNLLVNCPGKCVVYKNQFDQGMIVRRCCYSNCGSEGLNKFEGRDAYVCSTDMCNGDQADPFLSGGSITTTTVEEGSGEEIQSTTTPVFVISTTITIKTSQTTTVSCHECTGHYSGCGTSPHTIINNCRMCMVYKNVWDGNTIVRRCCYSNCGPANTVQQYEGRQTYFCASNLCNGIGSENALPSTRGLLLADDSLPSN